MFVPPNIFFELIKKASNIQQHIICILFIEMRSKNIINGLIIDVIYK